MPRSNFCREGPPGSYAGTKRTGFYKPSLGFTSPLGARHCAVCPRAPPCSARSPPVRWLTTRPHRRSARRRHRGSRQLSSFGNSRLASRPSPRTCPPRSVTRVWRWFGSSGREWPAQAGATRAASAASARSGPRRTWLSAAPTRYHGDGSARKSNAVIT